MFKVPLLRLLLCVAVVAVVAACSSDTTDDPPGGDPPPDGPPAVGDQVDVDGDGTPDGVAVDANGDGVADSVDTDNDGIGDTSLTGQTLRVHVIGGTVSGLAGSGLVLTNNGGDPLTVTSGATTFTFSAAMAPGETYDVAVGTQPTGPNQTCSVASGSGTVGTANVTNISVTCSTATYTIGGEVTGLTGYGLVLTNNGGDDLTLENGAGTFTFSTPIADGATYLVEVQTQPTGPAQTCTVTGNSGSGTVSGANVTSVAITCVTGYSVGGTITGLAGTGLVLTNNGGDDLTVPNGATTFTFATPVNDGSPYEVAVATNPTGLTQNCTIDGNTGLGTVSGAHVTSVSITCVTVMFTIGGTISNLAGDGLVLTNNGGDNLTRDSGATSFTFATPIVDGGTYLVEVETNPTGLSQTCTVDSGTETGTVNGAHVDSVVITCVTDTFTIGGTITNLLGDGLTLSLAVGGTATDTVEPDPGATDFVFSAAVDDGSSYSVAVQTDPSSPDQNCTVTGGSGSGTVAGVDVDTVTVNCFTQLYPVRVTLDTPVRDLLDSGDEITVQTNGANDSTVDDSRAVWEIANLADGSAYDIEVISSPTGLRCTVPGGSGTIDGGPVAHAVECAAIQVEPLYPTNGANWNDYVDNNGADVFSASDTVCPMSGSGYYSCIHGGEKRALVLTAEPDCTGLTATDTLDAFDWVCVDTGTDVAMVSTGLKDGVNLSDLIDFTVPYVFWDNAITVFRDGVRYLETEPAVWWGNNVTNRIVGGTYDSSWAGAILLVTSNIADSFNIDAQRVGLVIQPGVTLSGSAAGEDIIRGPNGRRFLWIEGAIDAAGDNSGVTFQGIGWSVFRNVTVSNATDDGVSVNSSTSNLLRDITVRDNGGTGLLVGGSNLVHHVVAERNDDGVRVTDGGEVSDVFAFLNTGTGIGVSGAGNRVTDLTAANNGGAGVYVGSTESTIRGVVAINNESAGVLLQSATGNTLEEVTTANNGGNGLHLWVETDANRLLDVLTTNNAAAGVRFEGSVSGDPDNNLLAGLTVLNNHDDGIHADAGAGNVWRAVVAANNGGAGVRFEGTSGNLVENFVGVHNGDYAISLTSASTGNRFTGLLGAGLNDGGGVGHNCYVEAESNNGDMHDDVQGGVDGTHQGYCLQTGSSDFISLVVGTLEDSFVARITIDDSANESDSLDTSGPGQSRTWPTDPDAFDWTQYENRYRAWGRDGDFPEEYIRNRWDGGGGHIWDWRLWDTDFLLQDRVEVPTTGDAADVLQHTWVVSATHQGDCDAAVPGSVFITDHCENAFLRAAIELIGDEYGNDNGLCETGEGCRATNNFGGYQGHGTFDSGTAINGDTLDHIVLHEYTSTGVTP